MSACMQKLNRKPETRMSSDAPVGKRRGRRGEHLHAEAEAREQNEQRRTEHEQLRPIAAVGTSQ